MSAEPASGLRSPRIVYLPEGDWRAPLNFSGVTRFLGQALERECSRRSLTFEVIDTSWILNTEELALLTSDDASNGERGRARLSEVQARHPLTRRLLAELSSPTSVLRTVQHYDAGCQQLVAERLREVGAASAVLLAVNPLNPSFESDAPVFYHLDALLAEFYFDQRHGVLRDIARPVLVDYWMAREQAALERARKVWVWSESGASKLRAAISPARDSVAVLPAGANLDVFPEPIPRRFDGPLRALFVGRNLAFKGRATIEHLVSNLPAGVRLTVVTDRAFHPSRPVSGVQYLPVLQRRQVLRLYAEHDVFLFPTEFDPYGLVLCEAMAHGLPVIASATRAVPEILGHGPRQLVPAADPGRFLERLCELSRKRQQLPALSLANYARAKERFDWKNIVARLVDGVLASSHVA
jgi:glycosyltransferase involved in cell wall biosynthesis